MIKVIAWALLLPIDLGQKVVEQERCWKGRFSTIIPRLRLASFGLALLVTGLITTEGWASVELRTGKAHPFVFVTSAEIDAARKAIRVRRAPQKLETFKGQQARASRWLRYKVPAELPFDRRHGGAVRDLAIAYVLRRDEIYAMKAAELLRAMASKPNVEHYSAIHLSVYTLPIVFGLDLLTPYLGSEAQSLQQRLLDPIVRTLRVRPRRSPSTLDVWANAAVAAIGFLREDQSLIDWAVFDPNAGVLSQIDDGIMHDGIWQDRVLHYHFYALQAFIVVAETMSRSGMNLDLYTWTSPQGRSLRQMFLSPIGLLDPHLTLPGSGDSFGTLTIRQLWQYLFAWRRYGDQEFAWILSHAHRPLVDGDVFATTGMLFNERELPEVAPPPEAPSRAYSDAGWLSLRSVESPAYWHSDAVQVVLSYGGGELHDHADKLNLDIAGFAERLVEDKSVFAYGDGGASPEQPERSRHHLWDRQTIAHNTVVVDQRSQPGGQAMFQDTGVRGQGEVFVRCGPVKVARASAHAVYPGVQYTRQVALVGSEYIVDLFRLESASTHVYDWVLHVNREPNEAPRSELAWQKVPPFQGGRDGYQLIRNLRRSHTAGTWSLEWPKLKLWMTGRMPMEVILAEGYGGPVVQKGVWEVTEHPEPSWTPMVFVRREVPRTIFAAVFEVFQQAPAISRVEDITTEPGTSAIRIHRPEGVDLFVTRWGRDVDDRVLVDPVTKVAVPIGHSFTLAQVRDERVQLWSDGPVGTMDVNPPPAPGASPAGRSHTVEPHQCGNELAEPPRP